MRIPGDYPLGTYIVSGVIKDVAGNPTTVTYKLIVAGDRTSPVITSHADITAEATSASGAVVNYDSPATSDNVDPAGTATCLPSSGSSFVIGTTAVTCNAIDATRNKAIPTTFNVIVKDTTAPVITLLGSNPVYLEYGSTYSDAGATSMDNVHGDITANIIVNSCGFPGAPRSINAPISTGGGTTCCGGFVVLTEKVV